MKTVCVLFGGVSSEHEVSLRSAAAVIEHIPRDRYEVLTVGITGDGRWLLYEGPLERIVDGTWMNTAGVTPAALSPDRSHHGLVLSDKNAIRVVDVIFPVLHGKNGEDGTVQGLAELSGIPCVGCGVRSSAVCMDKAVAHALLVAAGLPKTRLLFRSRRELSDLSHLEPTLAEELGYPLFVKPANAGSSVGVTKVSAPEELEAAVALALDHDEKVVFEQMVTGQEVECSVLGNGEPVASAVLGEIAAAEGVYDYASKYLNDTAGLHIPARISGEAAENVRKLAVRAYRALDCRGYARVDFFVRADGSAVLNEINTIPGFTSISMFPKLLQASGMSFEEITHRLIGYALEK